jgi:poly(A) polymerase
LNPDLALSIGRIASVVTGPVWAAGGFVRDLVLGRSSRDLDLAVTADAQSSAEAIASLFGGSAFALDLQRGTYRVAVPGDSSLGTVDLSLLRGTSIEADLRERDFTINAMAAELTEAGLGHLIDPLEGAKDAASGIVRMTSIQMLEADPLRLLRAARFAAELGFDVEPATAEAILERAGSVKASAAERQRDELVRILECDTSARGMRLLDRLHLLEVLFPESAAGRGFSQPGEYHYFDVLDHSIEAVAVIDVLFAVKEPATAGDRRFRSAFWDALGPCDIEEYFRGPVGGESRLAMMKLAALLHDVAKPRTKTVEGGRVRFLGHPEIGASIAEDVCKRLRFGRRETVFVRDLVANHLRPPQLSQSGQVTERAVFRFFRDLGDAAPACLVLSLADAAAAIGPRLTIGRWRAHLAYVAHIFERARVQSRMVSGEGKPGWTPGKRHFVSGDTLIGVLGVRPGPEVGRLLSAIDEAAASGEITSREDAIELARRIRTTAGAA